MITYDPHANTPATTHIHTQKKANATHVSTPKWHIADVKKQHTYVITHKHIQIYAMMLVKKAKGKTRTFEVSTPMLGGGGAGWSENSPPALKSFVNKGLLLLLLLSLADPACVKRKCTLMASFFKMIACAQSLTARSCRKALRYRSRKHVR